MKYIYTLKKYQLIQHRRKIEVLFLKSYEIHLYIKKNQLIQHRRKIEILFLKSYEIHLYIKKIS